MEQIVVTADRQATKRTEAPTVVNVLSSKLFDQTSSGNIADALGYVSGLRMEYTCSNCGTSQIRINGLEGQYSQILLDSRPVFSSLAAVYGLEQLPAGMVDRVEVIRGGGSALYGSNAIAGVVNIITKEPHRNSVSLANTTGFTESGTADVNTSLNASMLSDDRRAMVVSESGETLSPKYAPEIIAPTVSRIFRRSPRRLPASAPITRQEPIPN